MIRATEPQNIIWENRHTTFKEMLVKGLIVAIIIGVLLFGCLTLFIFLMQMTTANQSKYPPGLICEDLYSLFDWNISSPLFEYWAGMDKDYTLQ